MFSAMPGLGGGGMFGSPSKGVRKKKRKHRKKSLKKKSRKKSSGKTITVRLS